MTTPLLEPKANLGWALADLPPNVRLGQNTLITKRPGHDPAFKRFVSQRDPALIIGANCTMDGVLFNLGAAGQVVIGEFCYFHEAILLCDQQIQIGSHVFIGWQATLSDADFHPIDPLSRLRDAVACSPQGRRANQPRQPFRANSIIIEDNAYIGPHSVILKGVRIGAGAIIEAGTVIVRDVSPGARMMGNPAQQVRSNANEESSKQHS
jgi:acetyltransferase-like isoleucine patch superfamily enzyme